MDTNGNPGTKLVAYAGFAKKSRFGAPLLAGAGNILAVTLAVGAISVVGGMIAGRAPPSASVSAEPWGPVGQKGDLIMPVVAAERTLAPVAAPVRDGIASLMAPALPLAAPLTAPVAKVRGIAASAFAERFASDTPAGGNGAVLPIAFALSPEPSRASAAPVAPPVAKIVQVALRGAERAAANALDELLPGGLGLTVASSTSVDEGDFGTDASVWVSAPSVNIAANGNASAPVGAGVATTVATVATTVAAVAGPDGAVSQTVGTVGQAAGQTVGAVAGLTSGLL